MHILSTDYFSEYWWLVLGADSNYRYSLLAIATDSWCCNLFLEFTIYLDLVNIYWISRLLWYRVITWTILVIWSWSCEDIQGIYYFLWLYAGDLLLIVSIYRGLITFCEYIIQGIYYYLWIYTGDLLLSWFIIYILYWGLFIVLLYSLGELFYRHYGEYAYYINCLYHFPKQLVELVYNNRLYN